MEKNFQEVFELIDAGGREHGANRGKLQIAVVIHLVSHGVDGHIQFGGDAVKKSTGTGGADAAHLVVPDAHIVIEDHGFAVLTADIENGFAVGVEVFCTGDMGGHFTDFEVVGQEIGGVGNDLTAGNNSVADIFNAPQTGVGKEFIHCLTELSEIAGTATGTDAGTANSAGIDRAGALIQGLTDFTVFIDKGGFKGRRTDIYSKIEFFH